MYGRGNHTVKLQFLRTQAQKGFIPHAVFAVAAIGAEGGYPPQSLQWGVNTPQSSLLIDPDNLTRYRSPRSELTSCK